jgi:hypothetical protein
VLLQIYDVGSSCSQSVSFTFGETRMNADELIAKAKLHVPKIQPAGGTRLSADDFPKAEMREVAMVCFGSDLRSDRVYVFLDRRTGEFVTIMYAQGTGHPNSAPP